MVLLQIEEKHPHTFRPRVLFRETGFEPARLSLRKVYVLAGFWSYSWGGVHSLRRFARGGAKTSKRFYPM